MNASIIQAQDDFHTWQQFGKNNSHGYSGKILLGVKGSRWKGNWRQQHNDQAYTHFCEAAFWGSLAGDKASNGRATGGAERWSYLCLEEDIKGRSWGLEINHNYVLNQF